MSASRYFGGGNRRLCSWTGRMQWPKLDSLPKILRSWLLLFGRFWRLCYLLLFTTINCLYKVFCSSLSRYQSDRPKESLFSQVNSSWKRFSYDVRLVSSKRLGAAFELGQASREKERPRHLYIHTPYALFQPQRTTNLTTHCLVPSSKARCGGRLKLL